MLNTNFSNNMQENNCFFFQTLSWFKKKKNELQILSTIVKFHLQTAQLFVILACDFQGEKNFLTWHITWLHATFTVLSTFLSCRDLFEFQISSYFHTLCRYFFSSLSVEEDNCKAHLKSSFLASVKRYIYSVNLTIPSFFPVPKAAKASIIVVVLLLFSFKAYISPPNVRGHQRSTVEY